MIYISLGFNRQFLRPKRGKKSKISCKMCFVAKLAYVCHQKLPKFVIKHSLLIKHSQSTFDVCFDV